MDSVRSTLDIDVTHRLTSQQAHADIEQFRQLIHEDWMLADANDADFDAALDTARRRPVP